jgi:tRNA pseudouridine55 synthase
MSQQKNKLNINGWLIIDKPDGLTSSNVVGKVKYLTKAKKVGHAGTLDPMATGILPIALGEATKTSQYAMGKEKEYLFDILFGVETDTLDSEGKITQESDKLPTKEEILKILPEFIGDIAQIPPAFSAIKVDGKRSYALAREGKEVELKARDVNIEEVELLEQKSDAEFSFRAKCGKGTYIRSLARDIAYKLDTFGHITMLRRTRVGKFSEENAISLEKLEDVVYVGALFGKLLPIDTALDDIPVVEINAEEVIRIRHGQTVFVKETNQNSGKACAKFEGEVIALGTIEEKLFKPERVFNN